MLWSVERSVEILKMGLVGLIAGWFSSYMATRDHRYKKLWELRGAAYQSVIEALSDLTYYFGKLYEAEILSSELSDEKTKELNQIWTDGYHKVRQAADVGAFLFSEEAGDALKKFIKCHDENNVYETFFERVDSDLFEAKSCLNLLVLSSKKDLRLRDC